MYHDLVWGLNLIAAQSPGMKDKHSVALFPTQTSEDRPPSFLTYQGISSSSKYKEEAWRLIDFICSKEGQIRLWKIGRFMPARKSAAESSEVQGDPAAKVAAKASLTMQAQPPVPQWNEVIPIVGDATQQALTKAKTPEEAFKVQKDYYARRHARSSRLRRRTRARSSTLCDPSP